MIVVSDTSPLNYLVLIEEVEVLPTVFGRVVVPASSRRGASVPGLAGCSQDLDCGPSELSFTHISLLTEVLTVINLAAIFHKTVHLFKLSNELNENTIIV